MDDCSADIIALLDEDGNEYEFEILDKIEHEGEMFYALTPYKSDSESDTIKEEPYFIMQEINGEEDIELVEVTDDAILNLLAEEFTKRFNERFGE